MSAKEIFKKSGYAETLDDSAISSYEFNDRDFMAIIDFHKKVEMCIIYHASKLDKCRVDLNINELKAILAKCKELGWLDE